VQPNGHLSALFAKNFLWNFFCSAHKICKCKYSAFKRRPSVSISSSTGNLIKIYGKTIAGRYETLDFDADYIDG